MWIILLCSEVCLESQLDMTLLDDNVNHLFKMQNVSTSLVTHCVNKALSPFFFSLQIQARSLLWSKISLLLATLQVKIIFHEREEFHFDCAAFGTKFKRQISIWQIYKKHKSPNEVSDLYIYKRLIVISDLPF